MNITGGAIIAAGANGNKPIISNITLGNGTNTVFLIAGDASQQFGAGTVLTFNNGLKDAKFQLRGSNQTLAGIDSFVDSVTTLSIIQNDETGSPGFTAAPGLATLTIDTATNHSFTGLIRNQVGGGLNLVKEGVGTQEIRNAFIQADAFTTATVNNGTLLFNFILNAGNTHVLPVGSGLVANGAGRLVFDGDSTINGPISGNGVVVKQGPGTVTFAGANTFTNSFVLNDGILGIGNAQALGDPAAVITINGGNLRASGQARTVLNPITVNGSFILGRLTDLLGPITLTADATITGSNPDSVANNNSLLGPVGGAFRLTLAEGSGGAVAPFGLGTGALVVNAVNTNSGGTTVASGRVNVSTSGALANAPLAVNGGILNLSNTAQTVTQLSGTGGTINLAAGHTLTVNQTGAGTFAGAVAGAGTLVNGGPGALTLSGAQTYATLITNGGTTTLTTSLPAASITNNAGALTLNANATNSTVTVTGTTNVGANQTLAALNIGSGGVVTIVPAAPAAPEFGDFTDAGNEPALADAFGSGASAALQPVAAVPEPGAFSLLATGILGLLARRRRSS